VKVRRDYLILNNVEQRKRAIETGHVCMMDKDESMDSKSGHLEALPENIEGITSGTCLDDMIRLVAVFNAKVTS
jgi:hypothetical protein